METQLLRGPSGPVRLSRPSGNLVSEAVEADVDSRLRRCFFRGIRLMVADGLFCGATLLIRQHLTSISSDQAYINGATTPLRAPIGGLLQLEAWEPGTRVAAGELIFRVDNARFGNVEANAQWNWVQELVDRLRVDYAEAELRYAKQQELFKHHEALFKQNLMPRVEFLEEETRLELCRISMNSRQQQLRGAEARRDGIEQQVSLQKQAALSMPFDGVIWSVPGQNGSQVGAQETVMHVLDPKRVWVDAFVHEKHADKFHVGVTVQVRSVDGQESWVGHVESVRAGVGRVDPEQSVAVPSSELARRRIAVRVKLDTPAPFSASEFFGVGRTVKVTLAEATAPSIWSYAWPKRPGRMARSQGNPSVE